jgi:GntR family transcriptional regulator/MocR family aminotransferase
MDRHTPLIEQEALATMLESGAYDSHVRRVRRRNAERQQALLDALRHRFGDRIRIEGAAAGLHVVAWFDDLPQKREDTLVKAARDKGVGIYPVSALFVGPRRTRKTVGLVMGYSALEITQIERGCKLLAQAVVELD